MIIKNSKRKKKIISVRSKFGRGETHELLLFRSNKSIYGQVFSLVERKTVFSASTAVLAKTGFKASGPGKLEASRAVGGVIGKKCKELGVKPAINVAQYKYHGRVKALVEGFVEAIK